MIPAVRENTRVKLGLSYSGRTSNEIIDTPPIIADNTIKALTK